ncbi:MAG: hypothetical protein AAFR81_28035 [Chloroflexota bacterium]
MVNIRRKPLRLEQLDNIIMPDQLETIDFVYDIPAEAFHWLRYGYIANGATDFTGVYDTDGQVLYFLSTLRIMEKQVHWFICRLQIEHTKNGAQVIFAEVGTQEKEKHRLRELTLLARMGYERVGSEHENPVRPERFIYGIQQLISYAKRSATPFQPPDNRETLPYSRIHTPINQTITEQDFYHLMWGYESGRWYAYMDNMTVHWHRSWTGKCYFHMKLSKTDDAYLIDEIISAKYRLEPDVCIELTEELLASRLYEYELITDD